MTTSVISIRFNPTEQKLIERLAKFDGISPSRAVKRAALEKAENDIDYAIAVKASAEYHKSHKRHTWEELRRELFDDAR